MAKDVSIAFKASDGLSNTIKQMKSNVNALSRDVSEYRKVQSDVFDKKTEIKFDISKAKKELKELEKAVKDEKDGSAKAFKEKAKQLEELQEEYRRLGQVAKDASKAERQLQEDISRSSNKNASRMSSQKGLASSLAQAGLYNMVGQSLTNNLSYNMTSMFGSTVGSTISNIGGNLVTGAAMGSIAGPLGAILGGALGGLTGAINSMTEKQKKSDDLFRDEVKNLYSQTLQSRGNTLSGGISSASKREQDIIAFTTLLGGLDNANKFISDVQNFSAVTPFEMNNLLNTSKILKTYGYGQNDIIPMMTKVGDAGAALGLDAESINWVATSIGRMNSSGKTSLEYLNPLVERGIPAIEYLATEMGKTQNEIYDMISKGQLNGTESAKIILDSMGKNFAGSMQMQSETYGGYQSTLNDLWSQIDMSMGSGYNEKRKQGMITEISQLKSEVGDNMKEMYSMVGEYEANMENKYQLSIIKSMEELQKSQEYIQAKINDDNLKMSELAYKAKLQAEIDFKNSEEYQMKLQAEKGLVQNIQDSLIQDGEYVKFGEEMAKQFELGYSGAINSARKRGLFSPEEEQEVIYDKGSWWQQIGQGFKDLNKAKEEGQGKYAEAKSNNYQTTNKTESNVTQHINMTFNNMENKDPKSFMHEMTKELEKAKQNIARNSRLSIN